MLCPQVPITSKISNSFFMYSVDTKFIADIRENFPTTWTIYSNQTIRKHINIVNTIIYECSLPQCSYILRIKQLAALKHVFCTYYLFSFNQIRTMHTKIDIYL